MNLIIEKCSWKVDESGLHSLRMIGSNWTFEPKVNQINSLELNENIHYKSWIDHSANQEAINDTWKSLMRKNSHPSRSHEAVYTISRWRGKVKKKKIWNPLERVGPAGVTFIHDAFVSNEIASLSPRIMVLKIEWGWDLGTFRVISIIFFF